MENFSDHECPNSKNGKDVSLQELKDRLAEFAQVRGWDQYQPKKSSLSPSEVGELSEIFQWKGEVVTIRSIWKRSCLMFVAKIVKNATKYPVDCCY